MSTNEWRQHMKPVTDGIWETRKKKGRSRSSEHHNTKIWRRKSQYLVSRTWLWILKLTVNWFQELIKEGTSFICAMHLV